MRRGRGYKVVCTELLGGVLRSEIHDYRNSKLEHGYKRDIIWAIGFIIRDPNEHVLPTGVTFLTLLAMWGS